MNGCSFGKATYVPQDRTWNTPVGQLCKQSEHHVQQGLLDINRAVSLCLRLSSSSTVLVSRGAKLLDSWRTTGRPPRVVGAATVTMELPSGDRSPPGVLPTGLTDVGKPSGACPDSPRLPDTKQPRGKGQCTAGILEEIVLGILNRDLRCSGARGRRPAQSTAPVGAGQHHGW